jgi:hypothetical protein
VIEQPQDWPSVAGWLTPDLPGLNKAIVFRAMADIGICENPPSSNRSGRIDTYNTRAGAPLGSYWCASEATACYVDAGADVPPADRASCDVIMAWSKHEGLFIPVLQAGNIGVVLPGMMVLYGTPADVHHVGILIRATPYQIDVEGNTSFAGFSRNGEAMLVKKVDLDRVVGYVRPRARKAA